MVEAVAVEEEDVVAAAEEEEGVLVVAAGVEVAEEVVIKHIVRVSWFPLLYEPGVKIYKQNNSDYNNHYFNGDCTSSPIRFPGFPIADTDI